MNILRRKRVRGTDEDFEKAARDPQEYDALLNDLLKQRRLCLLWIAVYIVLILLLSVLRESARRMMLHTFDDANGTNPDLLMLVLRMDVHTIGSTMFHLLSLTVFVMFCFACDTRIKFLKMLRVIGSDKSLHTDR